MHLPHKYRLMRPDSSRVVAVAVGAAAVLSTAAAFAGAPPCPSSQKDAAEHPPTYRAMAARFAPRVTLRVWFHPDGQREERDRQPATRSAAVTAAPNPPATQPARRTVQWHEPFGWQVSLRWNVLDIAEAVVPELDETTPRLRSSECYEQRSLADQLREAAAREGQP